MENINKFDSIANKYDTAERMEIAKIIANTLRTYIANGNEKTAIDYGCGTGIVGLNLIDVFQKIIFVDSSNNMIEVVKNKIEKSNIQNSDFLCCDITKEYPKDLHADYIIVSQMLHHVKDVEFILSCLYNILNEGGHLLIVDFDKEDSIVSSEIHGGFEQGALINITKKLGFINAQSKTFYNGDKIFVNRDASLFVLDCTKNI